MDLIREFKNGDRVICVNIRDTSRLPWARLHLNDTGTVIEDQIDDSDVRVLVDGWDSDLGWYPNRWKLLEEAQVSQEPVMALSRLQLILQEKINGR